MHKRPFIPYILPLGLTGVLVLACSPAAAQSHSQRHSRAQVDFGFFYESLAPYGDWVEMEDYGWSWAPRVERGWRPYTRGQWVMTDYGWFWDSDEDFGWAAYHYGRWVNDRYYGWVWVPGSEWAPAWVSWRHGNGYTGWAPLPPRATWRSQGGLSIDILDLDAFIGARDYTFVQDRTFVDRGIYRRLLPPTQNLTIINVTTNVTNYTFVNERVVDSGLTVANVERALGRRVPRVRTLELERADAPRRARAGEVAIFRPEVRAAPGSRPAQGRSLVRGDQPPPRLAERRRQREQERQQAGREPDVTAKDVERRRPAVQTPDTRDSAAERQRLERETRQANAQQQREQQRSEQQRSEQQRARTERNAKAQADKLAKEAQQEAKANPKDKSKKKPKSSASPAPPPAEEKD